MIHERRRFLRNAGFALAGGIAGTSKLGAAEPVDWPIAVFEKAFEGLSFERLADAVAATGADGIEATIRPGGHIEPAAAEDELPQMVEALEQRGKRVWIAATHLRRADREAERLLQTLHRSGIRHYRLGYFHYDLDRPLKPQLAQAAAEVRGLAALNRELGMQGLYQNHASGGRRQYVGALGWDAARLVDGIDPDEVGLALDTRHLLRDTGSSWRTAVAVCRPHLRSIYVKDGRWTGPRGDRFEDVPLDTGAVNESVFETIRKGLHPMPLCLHVEWIGYRVFADEEIPVAVEGYRRDVETLRRWLNEGA